MYNLSNNTHTPHTFKRVHYEARTVSKWAVCIQLKCLLVFNNYTCFIYRCGVHYDCVNMGYYDRCKVDPCDGGPTYYENLDNDGE